MNWSPLFVSFKISLFAVILTFFIGTTFSVLMYNYKGKFKSVFDSVLNLPTVLPPVVIGFLILFLLGNNGVGKYYNIIFTWQAAVITSFVITFPLMYRSVTTSLQHLDKELIEVAKIFGANNFQILKYVIIPICQPGIVSGIMLSFARSLGEFGATLMVAGNIPYKTQTMSTSIYFHVTNGEYKTAFIWTGIIILISFIFMLMVNKKLKIKN